MPRSSFLRAALHLQRPHMNFGILICDFEWRSRAALGALRGIRVHLRGLPPPGCAQTRTLDCYRPARKPIPLPEYSAPSTLSHVFSTVTRTLILLHPVGLTPYRARRMRRGANTGVGCLAIQRLGTRIGKYLTSCAEQQLILVHEGSNCPGTLFRMPTKGSGGALL